MQRSLGGESIEILPGQYFDAETGLHYNHHRYMDPGIGRYLQTDPVGLEGGLSTYSYALGDPVGAYDPDGLSVIRGAKLVLQGLKKVGWMPTGFLTFKSAVRLRKAQKNCMVIADTEEEAFRLAQKIEKTAHPDGDMLVHPRDSHVRGGNQPHVQTQGIKGHVGYRAASALAATTYLGDGFVGNAVDLFNPLSIPKDLADVYSELTDDGEEDSCGCGNP